LETLFRIGERAAALSAPISFSPLRFSVEDNRPRLYLVCSEGLLALHQGLVAEFLRAGLTKPDDRPYAPHITIGRLKTPFDASLFPPVRAEYGFSTEFFGLYQSEQGSAKVGIYTLLKEFRFSGA
jgi:2'-5' RNA ligase